MQVICKSDNITLHYSEMQLNIYIKLYKKYQYSIIKLIK